MDFFTGTLTTIIMFSRYQWSNLWGKWATSMWSWWYEDMTNANIKMCIFRGIRRVSDTGIRARASRTCRDACRFREPAVVRKTFPAFPAHAQPAILRIWQKEAHGRTQSRGWTHNRYMIAHIYGRGMECFYGYFEENWVCYNNTALYTTFQL